MEMIQTETRRVYGTLRMIHTLFRIGYSICDGQESFKSHPTASWASLSLLTAHRLQ